MFLYNLDEFNKIDIENISNLRMIIPILYKTYFNNKKEFTFMEYSSDDFDIINLLLKVNPSSKIISLENGVFKNDYISDELQEQIDILSRHKNILFIKTDDLKKSVYSSIFNNVSILYIENIDFNKNKDVNIFTSLLKSIRDYTLVCFYINDSSDIHYIKTINWLENRWIGLFKKHILIFEKMHLFNQLNCLNYSIQLNCFNNKFIENIKNIIIKDTVYKTKINSSIPHYKTDNLLHLNDEKDKSILFELISNPRFLEIIDFLKKTYKINMLNLKNIFGEFAFSLEMKNDIIINQSKKITNNCPIINVKKNKTIYTNTFTLIIPLQSIDFPSHIHNTINYPSGSIIITNNNYNFYFPDLSNCINENIFIGYVFLSLECNLP